MTNDGSDPRDEKYGAESGPDKEGKEPSQQVHWIYIAAP
jgi:hypothetical protein